LWGLFISIPLSQLTVENVLAHFFTEKCEQRKKTKNYRSESPFLQKTSLHLQTLHGN
jgi:hypothetical protein